MTGVWAWGIAAYPGAAGVSAAPGGRPPSRDAGGGQVLVEVLLILPVFMLLIFIIMQIGFFSFQAIVTHHGAYETARIASLTAQRQSCGSCWIVDENLARTTAQRMFTDLDPGDGVRAVAKDDTKPKEDPQEHCVNCDVEVTLKRKVKIHLPMIGVFMPRVSGSCKSDFCYIVAVVRMPIERPLEK